MWSRDFERFQGAKFNTFLLILMFKFVLVQPWNIGVYRIDLVFVTELTVDLLSIKIAFDLVKNIFIIPYYAIESVKRKQFYFCESCSYSLLRRRETFAVVLLCMHVFYVYLWFTGADPMGGAPAPPLLLKLENI